MDIFHDVLYASTSEFFFLENTHVFKWQFAQCYLNWLLGSCRMCCHIWITVFSQQFNVCCTFWCEIWDWFGLMISWSSDWFSICWFCTHSMMKSQTSISFSFTWTWWLVFWSSFWWGNWCWVTFELVTMLIHFFYR